MTLSEAQASRHPGDDVRSVPLAPGFPSSRESPSLHAVLTTPVDRFGASRLTMWRAPAPGSSPTALAFPYTTDGRHPRYSFRGLLELHWYYGLQICSPTFCGLGCEASMKSVTRLHRSSAIQAYRELLVWDFHPLVIRAVRAHVVSQTHEWPPSAIAGIWNLTLGIGVLAIRR